MKVLAIHDHGLIPINLQCLFCFSPRGDWYTVRVWGKNRPLYGWLSKFYSNDTVLHKRSGCKPPHCFPKLKTHISWYLIKQRECLVFCNSMNSTFPLITEERKSISQTKTHSTKLPSGSSSLTCFSGFKSGSTLARSMFASSNTQWGRGSVAVWAPPPTPLSKIATPSRAPDELTPFHVWP